MGIVTHIATMKVLLCIVALLGVALAQENDCKDMNEKYCKERSHLCDKAAFKDFMKKFCSKTCGFCTNYNGVFEEIQRMNPEYQVGQECIKIQKDCLGMATTGIQKIQCWVQFGLCMGGSVKTCAASCIPPFQECRASAGRDWLKNFQCAATYIKCILSDCH